MSFIAAGLAFYGMLALVPALISTVSVYGLVADPEAVADVVRRIEGVAPAEVVSFVEGQLTSIVETSRSHLGAGFAISLLATLWAASNGTRALMRGINLAYGIDETRSMLRLRALSVALTVALVVFVVLVMYVIVAGHRWAEGWAGSVAAYGRWPVVGVATTAVLAGFYRYAPAERRPEWNVASLGAGFAAVAWLAASFAFSIYVSRFGNFNETYGTLAGVVVVLLWLYVSGFVVVLGAVLDRSVAEAD